MDNVEVVELGFQGGVEGLGVLYEEFDDRGVIGARARRIFTDERNSIGAAQRKRGRRRYQLDESSVRYCGVAPVRTS